MSKSKSKKKYTETVPLTDGVVEQEIVEQAQPEKNLGGRPVKDIDWDVFASIVQFRVTKKFCADHLGVGTTTIDVKLREKYDMTFEEYKESKSTKMNLRLQSKAIEMALAGNVAMMIFILKNICGFSDKPNEVEELKSSFQNIEDMLNEIQKRRQKNDYRI